MTGFRVMERRPPGERERDQPSRVKIRWLVA